MIDFSPFSSISLEPLGKYIADKIVYKYIVLIPILHICITVWTNFLIYPFYESLYTMVSDDEVQ